MTNEEDGQMQGLRAYVDEIVSAAPALTPEQQDKVALAFRRFEVKADEALAAGPDDPETDDDDVLITAGEAAELCGVVRSCIRVWVFRGHLEPVSLTDERPHQGYLYRRGDVLRCNEARLANAARRLANPGRKRGA